MNLTRRLGVAAGLSAVLLAGCTSPNWRVTRTDPDATIDVDYRFDDDDARRIYRGMVNDCLSRPWIDNFVRENGGRRPVVIVGTVRNATGDYIETKMVTKRVEEELINSQRVRVVADRDQRGEIRDERLQQRDWSDPATVKRMGLELGADFMMIGQITDSVERSRDQRTIVNYYQMNLELVHLETNEKVWIQTEEIKKVARR
jgi:uncharacterized protein (TIGR02722 family)